MSFCTWEDIYIFPQSFLNDKISVHGKETQYQIVNN